MQRSATIPVRVEKCVFGGDGLACFSGRAVFVPGVLPGESVRCRITAEKKDFLRGCAEEILEASPRRVNPECRYFGLCPGCAYMHTDHGYENELKNLQFAGFALRAGFREEQLESPLAPEPATGYRNKLVLHVSKSGGGTEIGYVKSDGQTVFPVERCSLVHPEINELLSRQLADPGFRHSVHHKMELTYRRTERNGAVFFRNAAPKGMSWLRENTVLGEISCPAGGFFQVNPGGVNALLEEMLREIGGSRPDVFLDLYCGAGLFSVAAASAGVAVIAGADSCEESVAAARYNLKERDRRDAEFTAGDAAKFLPEVLKKFSGRRVMAVLDPPRGGISAAMRKALTAMEPESRLVYISCNPATWARDGAVLAGHGFSPVRARMINQFARTGHFEVFSVFERKEAAQ